MMKTIDRRHAVPFALVTSMFLLWGLANNMTDTLLAAFKRIMSMSDTQTSLIQFAFYGSYFCFALPASSPTASTAVAWSPSSFTSAPRSACGASPSVW